VPVGIKCATDMLSCGTYAVVFYVLLFCKSLYHKNHPLYIEYKPQSKKMQQENKKMHYNIINKRYMIEIYNK
jgi:hypothetical protein